MLLLLVLLISPFLSIAGAVDPRSPHSHEIEQRRALYLKKFTYSLIFIQLQRGGAFSFIP